jgi:hypothetical protein
MFSLVLCELHFIPIHGKNETSDPNIETHYLLYSRYNPFLENNWISYYTPNDDEDDDEDDDDDDDEEYLMFDLYNLRCLLKANLAFEQYFGPHPCIRSYYKICEERNRYVNPEIGQVIDLPTGESVVIIKTIWLRIIQRKWKKIIDQRKQITQSYKSIKFREIHGTWPQPLPTLHGMLKNLR